MLIAVMPVAFEDVAASLGEDDNRAALGDRDRSDELLLAQMSEVAAAGIEWLASTVAEIVGVRDPERTDGGEGPRLRAAQEDVEVTPPDALAVRAARQVEIARENLARIPRVTFERVRRGAAPASLQPSVCLLPLRIGSAVVARVVGPTSEEGHARLHLATPVAGPVGDRDQRDPWSPPGDELGWVLSDGSFANKRLQLHHLEAIWV